MYGSFFGLRCRPFADRADPEFFRPTSRLGEILAAVENERYDGRETVVILGESGTGKTVLIRALLQRLRPKDHGVVLTCSAQGEVDLIRETCKRFGAALPTSYSRPRGLARLRRHLRLTGKAGRRSSLIVDQAENLTVANLSDLVTLTGLQQSGDKMLTIILVGRPPLRTLLARPESAGIHRQPLYEWTLATLTLDETVAYIQHRLQVAGAGDTELFDQEAVALIHQASRGIPRLINRMCNAAMTVAHGIGENRITRDVAREVTEETTLTERSVAARHVGVGSARDLARVCEHAPWDSRSSETLVGRLEKLLAGAEARMRGILAESEQRVKLIETRVSHVPDAITEARRQIHRLEQASERADHVESSLTLFAEQLADKAEAVQQRITLLMPALEAGENMQQKLQATLDQVSTAASDADTRTKALRHELTEMINVGERDVATVREHTARCEDVAARLASARAEGEKVAETLEAIVTSATPLREMMQRMMAEADGRIGQLDSHHAAAKHVLHELSRANVTAHSLIERTNKSTAAAEQAAKSAEQRSATLQDLHAAGDNLIERQTRLGQESQQLAERVAEQMASMQSSTETGYRLLAEFTRQANALSAEIHALRVQASRVEEAVASATAKPAETIAAAQTQAAQLERVCAAVRQVFGGLARAGLEAKQQAQACERVTDEATERLTTLRTETERASSTLHEWTEEAVRVQARLERTLQRAPSLHETHPRDALSRMSRALRPTGRLGEAGPRGEFQLLSDPDKDATRPGEEVGTKPQTRTEEVSALIEDAKRAAAGVTAQRTPP